MSEQARETYSTTDDWPLRPWLLAALLAAAGLLIDLVSGGNGPDTPVAWRAALTALVFFGAVTVAFTLERGRWQAPLAFAALAGLVMAGLAWRAVAGGDAYPAPQYGLIAGLVATAIAVPLFQAGFHTTRFATSYRAIHGHAWNDAIGAAGALGFTGASWLLLLVLSELFHLLRINLLRDLMSESWFGWAWSGAAFGAALGVLRNEMGILGTLQRVIMVVLSILAVPLAAGLALFLLAMIVSGPDVLWAATRNATPVLLLCAAAAWLLTNAILRDDDAEVSGSRVLRGAALVLALAVLPLTLFAAVSLGTRIAQHGLSPERLWGLVAIAAACAYGLAWFVAVLHGLRSGAWRGRVRQANLHLALLVGALALLLAAPILDFGAISARNQVARLERGQVSAKEFDYQALRWDFGAAGRRALATLTRSRDRQVADLARVAATQQERTWRGYGDAPIVAASDINVRVQPENAALRAQVTDYLRANRYACGEYCVALDLGAASNGQREVALVTGGIVHRLRFPAAGGGVRAPEVTPAAVPLTPRSKVEVRTIARRYVVVDGQPVGQPIDDRGAERLEGVPPRR